MITIDQSQPFPVQIEDLALQLTRYMRMGTKVTKYAENCLLSPDFENFHTIPADISANGREQTLRIMWL